MNCASLYKTASLWKKSSILTLLQQMVQLSEKILSQLFRLMGMSKVVLEFMAAAMLVPIGAISLSFFVFAYIVSRMVKKVKVAVRELVVE